LCQSWIGHPKSPACAVKEPDAIEPKRAAQRAEPVKIL
jgi:hypothetical protein